MKKGDKFKNNFKVSRKIYDEFKMLSNDKNPLHTNRAFAKKYGFSGKVMHGNILGAFISYFVGEMLPAKNVVLLSQELNFLNPVYLNNTLSFEATVVDFYKSVSVYEFKLTFKKKGEKIIASGKVRIKVLG